jgi:hypothetical protein
MKTKDHKKVMINLARCEQELDKVLFDTGDFVTGAGVAGVAGLGAGAGLYAYGRQGLKRKKTWGARDIGETIGRGASMLKKDAAGAGPALWQKILKAVGKAK